MKSQKHRLRYVGIILLFIGAFLTIKYYDRSEEKHLELSTEPLTEKVHYLENPSRCIQCHGYLSGMSEHHAELQCISCHGGNNEIEEKDSAHAGMRSIPGNLADAEESCALCHPQAFSDLQSSLMTSNSGIIAVDRYIFGETESPDELSHIEQLGHSAADTHLRNLCSHCHLGHPKDEFGPINELSRGGGCNACHLNYSKEDAVLSDSLYHPALTLEVSNDHCFGCHSRSGRISTNYEGWHETLVHKDSIPSRGKFRVLMDDRVFRYVAEDIHHTVGLDCIDCHSYEDIMGDGNEYAHEENAVKISCEDCHFSGDPLIKEYEQLNFTHIRILAMRENENKQFLMTAIDSTPLLNTYVNENGTVILKGKLTHQAYELNPPASVCTKEAGHKDVSCAACHNQWAPQCLGCHTDFDPNASGYDLLDQTEQQGSWIEYAGEFLAELPAMGVKGEEADRLVKPAIPGMIMTLDKASFPSLDGELLEFHRLYSQSSPHTIGKKGRSCTSCHTNPLALGYGRGKLTFYDHSQNPHWEFEPEYATLEDGLPADAWIGFLEELDSKRYSTRLDFLPFTREEQEKILTVGACFSCHKEDSEVMLESLTIPFEEYRKRMSVECLLPVFK